MKLFISSRVLQIVREEITRATTEGCAARYAVWKEQVRSLPIYSRPKLYAMLNYIHSNPVRRGLVAHPGDWEESSWRFYERGEAVGIDVTPLML